MDTPDFNGATQPGLCFETQNRTETDERTGIVMYGKNEKIPFLPRRGRKNSS